MSDRFIPIIILSVLFCAFLLVAYLAEQKTLNIKSKTVGDGQHGTARFASPNEIEKAFKLVDYNPKEWRKHNPEGLPQGLIIGSRERKNKITAIVDDGDTHALMIGAAGVGKTAKFLYPNIEYCCAAGMSFLTTDTKGDILRSYAPIAKKYYGYDICVLDL